MAGRVHGQGGMDVAGRAEMLRRCRVALVAKARRRAAPKGSFRCWVSYPRWPHIPAAWLLHKARCPYQPPLTSALTCTSTAATRRCLTPRALPPILVPRPSGLDETAFGTGTGSLPSLLLFSQVHMGASNTHSASPLPLYPPPRAHFRFFFAKLLDRLSKGIREAPTKAVMNELARESGDAPDAAYGEGRGLGGTCGHVQNKRMGGGEGTAGRKNLDAAPEVLRASSMPYASASPRGPIHLRCGRCLRAAPPPHTALALLHNFQHQRSSPRSHVPPPQACASRWPLRACWWAARWRPSPSPPRGRTTCSRSRWRPSRRRWRWRGWRR